MMLFGKPSIQLQITIPLDSNENMFDFNSKREQDKQKFSGVKVYLPVPKDRTYFYFFHQNRTKRDMHVKIEHRIIPVSDSSFIGGDVVEYRLLGGVELKKNQEGKVVMRLIEAGDINQKGGNGFTKEQKSKSPPYLVIRSFKYGQYKLKQRQIIKLGRLKFMVTDVVYGMSSEAKMIQQGDIMMVQTRRETSQDEEIKCRFCLMDQTDMTTIFAPCECTGTSKYIHVDCLKLWLQSKNKCIKEIGGTNRVGDRTKTRLCLICEVCKHKLPKIVVIDKVRHYLLDIYKNDQPSISFEEMQDGFLQGYLRSYNFALHGREAVEIGRLGESHVSLNDICVSRKHCWMGINRKGEIVVGDRGSKYGTLVYDQFAELEIGRKRSVVVQMESVVFGFKIGTS